LQPFIERLSCHGWQVAANKTAERQAAHVWQKNAQSVALNHFLSRREAEAKSGDDDGQVSLW
jgi:hypothetical protein